jgi:hypothetical protein
MVNLLEPQSHDGLVSWGFLDDHVKVGQTSPVTRLRSRAAMLTAEWLSPDPIETKRPITSERP